VWDLRELSVSMDYLVTYAVKIRKLLIKPHKFKILIFMYFSFFSNIILKRKYSIMMKGCFISLST